MPAGKLNITIEKGATFNRTITYKDAAGDPVNLTGATVRGKMRPTYASATSQAFTFNVPTPTNGQIEWSLSAVETAALSTAVACEWVYDIEVEFLGGRVERLLEGVARISPEVTYT